MYCNYSQMTIFSLILIFHVCAEFGRVCGRTTELHFPDLEDQLEATRDLVPQVVQWRRDHPPPQYDCDEEAAVCISINSSINYIVSIIINIIIGKDYMSQ